MAELDAKERNKLPSKDFGLPAERKYPLENDSHAADAKGRAKQMLKRGTISQGAYDKICAKADKVMGKTGAMKDKASDKGDDAADRKDAKSDAGEGDMTDGADGASKDQTYKGGKSASAGWDD